MMRFAFGPRSVLRSTEDGKRLSKKKRPTKQEGARAEEEGERLLGGVVGVGVLPLFFVPSGTRRVASPSENVGECPSTFHREGE